jgi:hypothetical protein
MTRSYDALVWTALLGEPMEVLGPPELVEATRGLVMRLSAAAGKAGTGADGG